MATRIQQTDGFGPIAGRRSGWRFRIKTGVDFRIVLGNALILSLVACGGGPPPPPIVSVIISPSAATVQAAHSQQFTAAVMGPVSQSVSWAVNGVIGGNATAGTISATGLYTAPAIAPSPNTVTVTATSSADANASASAQVTINAVISVGISPSSVTVEPGQSQQFTSTVTGSVNQFVSWAVNGVSGGNAIVGTISATGLYTAPVIVPSPSAVTVTATSNADPSASASAQVTVAPLKVPAIDFSSLPALVETNLGTFFVSGSATPGDTVTVNGTSVSLDSAGNFVLPIALTAGANRIEVDIKSASGTRSFVKLITFNPTLSTANRRLLYVSSIAQSLSGTIVIDVDNNIFLGFIANKHVRGVSPDGSEIYMDDRSVISTATHRELPPPSSPLAFGAEIPSDGFLVSPDGTRLYSTDEVLDLGTNQVLSNRLPVSIETGLSFLGPNQGGPAISKDGKKIFCISYFHIMNTISTSNNSLFSLLLGFTGHYWSDVALTPDGRLVLVSSYEFGIGYGDIFDADFNHLAAVQFGDFAGQIAVSQDGTKAIFGSAGNPIDQGGGVTVVDLTSFKIDAQVKIDLADHVTMSDLSQLFVSSGDTPGIDEFALQADGTLLPLRRFLLGINQFVPVPPEPQQDDIEKIVFKP